MTSPSLFPGVKDTRRPARVSTFWAESAPISPEILKNSQIQILRGWIGWQAQYFKQVSSLIIIIYYSMTPRRLKRGLQQGGV